MSARTSGGLRTFIYTRLLEEAINQIPNTKGARASAELIHASLCEQLRACPGVLEPPKTKRSSRDIFDEMMRTSQKNGLGSCSPREFGRDYRRIAGSRESIRGLLSLAAASEHPVDVDGVAALLRSGGEFAVEPLVECLGSSDEGVEFVEAALADLAHWNGTEVTAAILKALNAPLPPPRAQAVFRTLLHRKLVEHAPLTAALDGPDAEVLTSNLTALAQTMAPPPLDLYAALAAHPRASNTACALLEETEGGEAILASLLRDAPDHSGIQSSLERCGDRACPHLLGLVEERQTRQPALQLLARCPDRAIREAFRGSRHGGARLRDHGATVLLAHLGPAGIRALLDDTGLREDLAESQELRQSVADAVMLSSPPEPMLDALATRCGEDAAAFELLAAAAAAIRASKSGRKAELMEALTRSANTLRHGQQLVLFCLLGLPGVALLEERDDPWFDTAVLELWDRETLFSPVLRCALDYPIVGARVIPRSKTAARRAVPTIIGLVFSNTDKADPRAAAGALQALAPELTIDEILLQLRTVEEREESQRRETVANALASAAQTHLPARIDTVARALDNCSAAGEHAANRILRGAPAALDGALVELVHEVSTKAAVQCIEIASRTRDDAVLGGICHVLLLTTDDTVAAAAAKALGKHPTEQPDFVLEALISALQTARSPRTREEVVRSLEGYRRRAHDALPVLEAMYGSYANNPFGNRIQTAIRRIRA